MKESDDDVSKTTRDGLASLTPREAKILRQRFGPDRSTDHTLNAVSKQFDVTRERIRQIEARALRKLRPPTSPESDRDKDDSDTVVLNLFRSKTDNDDYGDGSGGASTQATPPDPSERD